MIRHDRFQLHALPFPSQRVKKRMERFPGKIMHYHHFVLKRVRTRQCFPIRVFQKPVNGLILLLRVYLKQANAVAICQETDYGYFSQIADIEKQNSSHPAPPLQVLSLRSLKHRYCRSGRLFRQFPSQPCFCTEPFKTSGRQLIRSEGVTEYSPSLSAARSPAAPWMYTPHCAA